MTDPDAIDLRPFAGPVRIVDLTIPITDGMDAYPGEPTAHFRPFSRVEDGGIAMSYVEIFSQLGTHVDAPAHFVRGGATSEALALEACIGPAVVIDARGADTLGPEVFRTRAAEISTARRVVVNTGWSTRIGTSTYWSGFAELTNDAARLLGDWGVRFLGLDTPTPSLSDLHAVHHTLLERDVVLVECLARVGELGPTTTIVCLPLPLVGLDGAPVRVVALEPPDRDRSDD